MIGAAVKDIRAAGDRRWRIAQTAEARYWEVARQDEVELLRILHEKASAMRWARHRVPAAFDTPGPWVEIGIGPLGIGCVHVTAAGHRDLIGVDPLPPLGLATDGLSTMFSSLLESCHAAAYRHVTGRGEHLDLDSGLAALVVCYNVLDHCDDPAKVVGEAARILRSGGHFVLGCDVYSAAGRFKYALRHASARITRTALDTIGDLAHPHQFVASDLERLIAAAGLITVAVNTRPNEGLKRLCSRSFRMLLVARKR